MKFLFAIIVSILLIVPSVVAQELDCEVTAAFDAITTAEARDNLSDFLQQIKQYVNTYRWTKEDFGNEKIKCTINIYFKGTRGDNHYMAQAFIGSTRPIYKSNHSTAVTRIMDENWEFDYIRNQTLIHSDNRFDPLTSLIDFYAYLLLGYDADTYKTNGGTTYFQKAMDIVNLARGSASQLKGWEPLPQGLYSRAQIVDELLNPKFQDFRKAVHIYYFRGLDSLFKDTGKSLKKMFSALEKIGKLQEKINQRTLIIKAFFDTQYREIADTFFNDPDPEIYVRLSKIDPSHQKTYDEYYEKRK